MKRNHSENTTDFKPAIMGPAGSRASFLAAVAAGADAIYCGTKLFSARMQAQNFSPQEPFFSDSIPGKVAWYIFKPPGFWNPGFEIGPSTVSGIWIRLRTTWMKAIKAVNVGNVISMIHEY